MPRLDDPLVGIEVSKESVRHLSDFLAEQSSALMRDVASG